jgi:hypothetical protein
MQSVVTVVELYNNEDTFSCDFIHFPIDSCVLRPQISLLLCESTQKKCEGIL